jgi:broad specificity phosphatase PhoE
MEIFFVRHAQTQQNVDGISYDNFGANEYYPITDHGKEQAHKTGKYLKQFGKFDLIISSPRHRCLETFEQISKSIKYDKFVTSDLLLEQKAGDLNGLNNEQVDNFVKKNKKLSTLTRQIEKENNPLKKIKLIEKYENKKCTDFHMTQLNIILANYKKFISQIKKLDYKRILVIGHGGTLYGMISLLCNINLYVNEIPKGILVEKANCMIVGFRYNKPDFELVIPLNNEHLKKL